MCSQAGTYLLDQRCGVLSRSFHVDSHLSDTVLIDMTKLQKRTIVFTQNAKHTPFHSFYV